VRNNSTIELPEYKKKGDRRTRGEDRADDSGVGPFHRGNTVSHPARVHPERQQKTWDDGREETGLSPRRGRTAATVGYTLELDVELGAMATGSKEECERQRETS
jgi:hypothetical protein